MKKLKNLSHIRVKGLNQERVFSKVSKDCKIFNLSRKEKSISELDVKNADLKKVKNQIACEGLEVEVLSSGGFGHFFKKFSKNWGIIAALILSFVFYIVQFGFVWKIKVYGTEKIDSREVVEYINQNFAKSKKNIKTQSIELGLKENFARISSVSVAIVGQTLVVNIYETVYPTEMQGQFEPIIAEADCKIAQVQLIQGTLNVRQGDVVQKGEVLVYPFIIDSQGEKREVKAEAIIKADVWLMGCATHYDSYYRTFRTGKTCENGRVLLNGLEIYANTEECKFESYESEKSLQRLSQNQVLPLIYEKTTYYETATELVEQSFDEVRSKKIEEAKQNALIFIQEYDIIKSEDINLSSGSGFTQVDVVITVERKIGGKSEDIHKKS